MISTAIIKEEVNKINDLIINWRRQLHQYPELAFQERKTAALIAGLLKKWGYQVQEGVGETGVIGLLKEEGAVTIGLRFEMDGLPLTEETNLPYKSRNKGVMHACGHDGHLAIGLGTALVLSRLKERFKGNVKFIFQPAEEGEGGALRLLQEGVLKNPRVDLIVGLHIWPEIEAGKIGVRPGPMMAAADRFDIKIIGNGGHGALPHLTVDPVSITAEIINGLQSLISRETNPNEAVVLSIGSLCGGTAFNVIPTSIKLSGTIRTITEDTRSQLIKRIIEKVRAITASNRGDCQISFNKCFSTTTNDLELVTIFQEMVSTIWGKESLVQVKNPSMTSEDFSEYQQQIPGLYFFLGTRNEQKGITHFIHQNKYNLDEEVLPFGVEVMTNFTLKIMEEKYRPEVEK